MSPMECAMGVADFIKNVALKEYKPVEGQSVVVNAGFLPKTTTSTDKKKQVYNVVVRPTIIEDVDDFRANSTVELQILVQCYDNDNDYSCMEVYHLLELIRQGLLLNPVIAGEYRKVGSMKTTIPEEQPFPRWWGYILLTYEIHKPTHIYSEDFMQFKHLADMR